MKNEFLKGLIEISDRMAELEKEERKEKQDEACKQLYSLYESLTKAGFIPDMAENILLIMLEKGLNGENYE